jgi:hypothetical protein
MSKQKGDCLEKLFTVEELAYQHLVKALLWIYLLDPSETLWRFNCLRPTRVAASTGDGIKVPVKVTDLSGMERLRKLIH